MRDKEGTAETAKNAENVNDLPRPNRQTLLARVERHAREAVQWQQAIGLRTASLAVVDDHGRLVVKHEIANAQVPHHRPVNGPIS